MSDRQHQIFEAALNKIRCPKCKGKVLETMMPDAVCEKCGTQYVLATRMGKGLIGGGLHAQLIEKNQSQAQYATNPQMMQQAPAPSSGKFCHNCGTATSETAKFCNKCGAQLS